MARKLKLWNGRWGGGAHGSGHCFVAAYSVEDAVQVVTEFLGYEPRGIRGEIKNYWNAGCWGTQMDGITPVRGLWLSKNGRDKPERAAHNT
jgi:hypothetical protein